MTGKTGLALLEEGRLPIGAFRELSEGARPLRLIYDPSFTQASRL